MGNYRSRCLAKIVTRFPIQEVKEKIEKDKISFLLKYVDYIGGEMDDETILVLEFLKSIVDGLSIKRTDGDDQQRVSYLNCKMNKRDDNSDGSSWWQKSYSSCHIMNFYSNHSNYVVKEYITTSPFKKSVLF